MDNTTKIPTISMPEQGPGLYPQQPTQQLNYSSGVVHLSYFERLQKNKPQANSVAPAFLFLMASGIHLAWGIFRMAPLGHWIISTNSTWAVSFTIVAWFLAANLGGLFSLKAIPALPKKLLYYICGGLLIASGVLFMVWYDHIAAIIVARMLAGFVHGIVHPILLINGAENSVKELRGYLVANGTFIIWLTIVLGSMYFGIMLGTTTGTNSRFVSIEFIAGVSVIMFALIGILTTPCLTYESVVKLIEQGQDDEAIRTMMKLRNESVETWEIRNEFNDLRLMVQEDKSESCSLASNIRPLLIVLLAKALQTLAMVWPLNDFGITLTTYLFAYQQTAVIYYATIVMISGTFLTTLISVFLIDQVGRKKLLLISGCACAMTLILLGIILVSTRVITFWIPGAFFIAFYTFAGIGLYPVPDVMMAEAFSTTKKLNSIVFINAIMNFVHIIAIFSHFHTIATVGSLYAILFTIGILLAIGIAVLYKFMPETRMMSLRQSRDEYRRVGFVYSTGQNITGITYS